MVEGWSAARHFPPPPPLHGTEGHRVRCEVSERERERADVIRAFLDVGCRVAPPVCSEFRVYSSLPHLCGGVY